MLFLYRFFCGVLEIEFTGVYPEKVLNLCSKNKINVWAARFINGKISCKITVKDFWKLPSFLKKSGIRVHIKQKSGFPFFFKKYDRRFGIFTGVAVFFVFLYIMSGYIWVIDVKGNTVTDTNEILKVCEEIGIKAGVRRNDISQKNSAQQMLLRLDSLAWGSINIEGCRITVNVTEIKEKAEDNSIPTNLKASADGIITHIDVKSGNCLVKVGDIVKKGDLLVSGIIETEADTQFVHSVGTITAKTQTAVILKEPIEKTVYYPTGEVKEKSVFEIFTLKIPLFSGCETGSYDTYKTEKSLSLFGQSLPLKIYSKRFVFKNSTTVTQTEEIVKRMLEKKLKKEYKGTCKSKEYRMEDGEIILDALLENSENIAVSEKLILGIGK